MEIETIESLMIKKDVTGLKARILIAFLLGAMFGLVMSVIICV